MRNLTNFIKENKQASITDLVYESNFHAEDVRIADLDPKMQDVEKFKLLVKKWDNLGEEVPAQDDEHYAGTNFEIIEKKFNDDTENKKEKIKVQEARNNFSDLYRIEDRNSKEYIKEAIKIYGAYIDAWYAWAKKYSTYGKGQNKWIDTSFIVTTFLGLGSWIINYGLKENIQNQLLGKLIKKFDKDMGKKNGVEGVSAFLKMYDEKKASLKRAFEFETNTINSIKELEKERKDHKYTIFGGFVEGQGEILFFDNSKYDSFDEIFEAKPFTKDDCKYFAWTKYNTDSCLRSVLKTDKVPGCFLCSGYYTFDNKDPENIIPRFGFCEEIPKKIYKYSSYDKKFFYRGTPRDEGDYYRYFDSLWGVYKEE